MICWEVRLTLFGKLLLRFSGNGVFLRGYFPSVKSIPIPTSRLFGNILFRAAPACGDAKTMARAFAFLLRELIKKGMLTNAATPPTIIAAPGKQ